MVTTSTPTAPAASPGAPAGDSTIQLIGIRLDGLRAFAIVQRDNQQPIELTWSLLHEAQQQEAPAGFVYAFLMREYTRAEYRQRNGKTWTSPRRTIREIAEEVIGKAKAKYEAETISRTAAAVRQAEIAAQSAKESARNLEQKRVAEARKYLDPLDPWYPIHSWDIPDRLRFDVLRHDSGQIVEVAYGTFSRGEAGPSDGWMRAEDRSEYPNSPRRVRYYRRRDVSGQSGQSGQ